MHTVKEVWVEVVGLHDYGVFKVQPSQKISGLREVRDAWKPIEDNKANKKVLHCSYLTAYTLFYTGQS